MAWTQRHVPALACGALFVAIGLLYSFLWGPVVQGIHAWVQDPDLWATYHSAQYVSWGDYGQVYATGSGLVTVPAISILLAPVAWISDALGWRASFPFFLPTASAWPLLDVAQLLLTTTPLFGLDTLARSLGVTDGRRWALSLAGAVVLFPVVMFGHPEDALALAFALASMSAVFGHRWRAAGWLMGAGLAFQPLVLLTVPVLVAVVPDARRRLAYLGRSAVPMIALLVVPLLVSFKATVHAFVDQPNFPTVDHSTPWLFLAPVLSHRHWAPGSVIAPGGGGSYSVARWHLVAEVVGAGPGRLIALLGAGLLGVFAARVHPSPARVVWLIALCLSLRCVFESVMDPYYYVPALLLMLLTGSAQPLRRWVAVLAVCAFVTVDSELRFSPWAWWGPLTAMMAVGLLAAYPSGSQRPSGVVVAAGPAESGRPARPFPSLRGRWQVTRPAAQRWSGRTGHGRCHRGPAWWWSTSAR